MCTRFRVHFKRFSGDFASNLVMQTCRLSRLWHIYSFLPSSYFIPSFFLPTDQWTNQRIDQWTELLASCFQKRCECPWSKRRSPQYAKGKYFIPPISNIHSFNANIFDRFAVFPTFLYNSFFSRLEFFPGRIHAVFFSRFFSLGWSVRLSQTLLAVLHVRIRF